MIRVGSCVAFPPDGRLVECDEKYSHPIGIVCAINSIDGESKYTVRVGNSEFDFWLNTAEQRTKTIKNKSTKNRFQMLEIS